MKKNRKKERQLTICKKLLRNQNIGRKKFYMICYILGIKKDAKLKSLRHTQIRRYLYQSGNHNFFNYGDQFLVINNEYLKELYAHHKFQEKMKSYHYYRNKDKLPVRGQRTKTNAKTKRKFQI